MIKGVLLDLGGVVFVGNETLPGAIAAIEDLKACGLAVRYVTNTTRTPKRLLLDKLSALGLPVTAAELFMPAIAARDYLEQNKLTPHLLVHPALVEDFAGLPATAETAVVIGDAAEGFTYAALNAAFRALNEGAAFLALAHNRSFQDADGELSLDTGAFVTALEYAAGRKATVLGKPSTAFFAAALESLNCQAQEVVMVGDDVEADVAGALAAGIRALLVRTGRYRLGDEASIDPPPTATVADLPAAADWIMTQRAALSTRRNRPN